MKDLEPKIIDAVDVLTAQLILPPADDANHEDENDKLVDDASWSEPKDMAAWASHFAVDVMGALVFSRRFGLMERPDLRWLGTAVPQTARSKYAACFVPRILTSGLDTWISPSLTGARRRVRAFAVSQLKARFARKFDEEEGKELHDLFAYILHAEDPETGQRVGTRELGSESTLLISAGESLRRKGFLYIRHRSKY